MYGKKNCMKCGKPATTKFTRIEKGQVYDIFLCAEHAAEMSPYQKPKIPLSDILEGLLKQNVEEETPTGPKAPAGLRCAHCGLTFQSYKKHMLLGCSDCYEAFRDYLIPDMRRFHGDTRHRGRAPGGGLAKPGLNEELARQIQNEAASAIAPARQEGDPAQQNEQRIQALMRTMNRAIAEEDFAAAARCRDELQELRRKIEGDSCPIDQSQTPREGSA
jgi:protein arginine kinase activator